MPLSSGLSIHDDTKHKGSAKRDVINGVAGLTSSGDLEIQGWDIYTRRDGSGNTRLVDRSNGEIKFQVHRNGLNDYQGEIKCGGLWSILQSANMKDIANGIAGLDANAKIPHDSLRVGSHRSEHIRKVVSANLRHSHDSEDPILSGAWAKYKSITFTDGISGTLRVKHTTYCENDLTGSTFSRVYKNGSPLGAIHENSTTTSYEEYSEDLNVGDLQPGDTLELWAYDGGYPDSRSVKNFRVYCDNEVLTGVTATNS